MGSSKRLIGKALAEYKTSLMLTSVQKDVLIGSILGDGNLRILKQNAFLTVSHSEKQKDYVLWKYNLFKKWVLTYPRQEKREYYKDNRRQLISWRWSTVSHPTFTYYYHLFYPHGEKLIPDSIKRILISPLSLAVWCMDDGSRKPYGKGAFLHTQSFTLDDQLKLIEVLRKNFSIDARISSAGLWKGKRLNRLYITAGSFLQFRNLVLPYMLPSMFYKVSL